MIFGAQIRFFPNFECTNNDTLSLSNDTLWYGLIQFKNRYMSITGNRLFQFQIIIFIDDKVFV